MNFTDQPFIVELDQIATLKASGTDARSFLQGQLSSDLRLLTPTQAQISSYNSAKGRMLAVLHLLADGDDVLLELHQSVAAGALKRLRMHVLRAKLTLEDISVAQSTLGVAGVDAGDWLTAQGLPMPQLALECAHNDSLTVLRRFGNTPRYTVHGPTSALAHLREAWTLPLPPDTAQRWQALEILAGVPTVFAETVDHFVPQMANLDQLGGISFDKGCYTGQEIVARLHYLGQLKRRMVCARSDVVDAIAPGTAVYTNGEAQAVGEVVQAARVADDQWLSVVLQLSHAQSAHLRVGSVDGALLEIL